MADIVLSKPQEISIPPSGQTATITNETGQDGGSTLGDGENETVGEEREGEKEDFTYRSPENQKSVQPQSWEKQALCRTREWRVRYRRVKLCSLVNPFYFVSPSALYKGNGVYACGRATVAC